MDVKNEICVDFSSRMENVAFARLTAAAFLLSEDPTVEELGDIKTAVSEAVTNAIVHGYRDAPGVVRLRARLDRNGLVELEIVDNGCGIADIARARRPFFSGTGGERAGMGFLVMESFMDSVEVESAPGEGTRVLLRKRLGAEQSAAARA